MHTGQDINGDPTSVVPIPPQGIANWLYMLFSKLAVGITSEFILLCTNTLRSISFIKEKLFMHYLFNNTKVLRHWAFY